MLFARPFARASGPVRQYPMRVSRLTGLVFCLWGCASGGGSGQLDGVRFSKAPVVWEVDDRKHTPEVPAERIFLRNLYFFQQSFVRPTERGLDRVVVGPAANVNALGEVPNSTWFENRIGWGLPAEALRAGPNRGDGPVDGPWRVLSTKVGGISPGFVIEDSAGQRFILKFDHPDAPEVETASHVVCQRLLWAIGYHVPEDSIVRFAPDRLVLAEDAVEKDPTGRKRPLTEARLRSILAPLRRAADGRVRGLTSLFLPGRPLGGFPQLGIRKDDPNDHIPHELRREIRGAWLFFAWLNHTDVKEDNMLDVYVTEPDRSFVQHYFLDFGKALGGLGKLDRIPMDGYAYYFDVPRFLENLASLGLAVRTWEVLVEPEILGVGRIEADEFEPKHWKPFYPYIPFQVRDELDDLWAARILRRLTKDHIRVALEAGRYSNPRAVEYLERTLLQRQAKLLRWAYERSNSLDLFEARGSKLCFHDLWHADGFGEGNTEYTLELYDESGRSHHEEVHTTRNLICAEVAQAGLSAYRVLRVYNERLRERPPVDVHLEVNRSIRILGIRRHSRR